MGRKYKEVEIDRVKFERALKELNLSFRDVSRKLGFGDTYISGRFYRGSIYENTAVLLEQFYNIRREDIEKKKTPELPQEVVTKPDSALSDQDWARLYRLLVEAIKEALS